MIIQIPDYFLTGFEKERRLFLFFTEGTITTHYLSISRRYLMQKLIIIGFAALCLIGTSSLALADEGHDG